MGGEGTKQLIEIMNMKVPKQWTSRIALAVHSEVMRQNVNNYREITLPGVLGKILILIKPK